MKTSIYHKFIKEPISAIIGTFGVMASIFYYSWYIKHQREKEMQRKRDELEKELQRKRDELQKKYEDNKMVVDNFMSLPDERYQDLFY